MTLAIKANDSLASIISRVRDRLPTVFFDGKRLRDCYTIIDEFHANIREHVAPQDPGFQWWLTVSFRQSTVILRFEYVGPCFDPTQVPEMEPQAIELRPIGGLGLTLINQLSEKTQYSYQNGLNSLTVEVAITADSEEDDKCL